MMHSRNHWKIENDRGRLHLFISNDGATFLIDRTTCAAILL